MTEVDVIWRLKMAYRLESAMYRRWPGIKGIVLCSWWVFIAMSVILMSSDNFLILWLISLLMAMVSYFWANIQFAKCPEYRKAVFRLWEVKR